MGTCHSIYVYWLSLSLKDTCLVVSACTEGPREAQVRTDCESIMTTLTPSRSIETQSNPTRSNVYIEEVRDVESENA